MEHIERFEGYELCFSPSGGGFPTRMIQPLRSGEREAVVETDAPWLTVTLAGGERLLPALPPDFRPQRLEEDGRVLLDFWNVPFCGGEGEPRPGYRLNLSWELNGDGVGFARLGFLADSLPLPEVKAFTLRIPMAFGEDADVCYGWWQRPESAEGALIQAIGSFVRGVSERKDVDFGDSLVPLVAFDFGEKDRLCRHIEWMLEGQNSLGGDPRNTGSRLEWGPRGPVLVYELSVRPTASKKRPLQWRNQLGFVIGQTPRKKRPPLRLYHHIDLYDRYPTPAQIDKMAAEGADALVLHEGWRTDLQNGGAPYDEERFGQVLEACRGHGIRLLPYVRGNEPSIREEAARWFGHRLRRDFDGLYMDYGGPVHYLSHEEDCPGGRFGFREHYNVMRRLRRETLGENGLLISHTGPFFCGTSLCSLADGYTSGEGEKGVMLSSRREHSYYSAASLTAGALWTAAFPEYKTARMLPYMASVGQYPHVTLGEQIKSSSLAHPGEPGCVTFMRPLWRLYGLLKGERGVEFANDLCDDSFRCDSGETGAALFTASDGARLLLISNFRDREADCSACLPDFPGANPCLWRLTANEGSCSAEPWVGGLSLRLPAYGIGGYLACPDTSLWRERLEAFAAPYPAEDGADRAYFEGVEEMRRLRFEPERAEKLYLRIGIELCPIGWEDEIWWDLFDCAYELYAIPEGGERQRLGWLGSRGLTSERPEGEGLVWPGDHSPWLPLHELLGPGRTRLELRAVHGGESFYSFIEAELSEDGVGPERTLLYKSELDPDRSRLSFDILL